MFGLVIHPVHIVEDTRPTVQGLHFHLYDFSFRWIAVIDEFASLLYSGASWSGASNSTLRPSVQLPKSALYSRLLLEPMARASGFVARALSRLVTHSSTPQ